MSDVVNPTFKVKAGDFEFVFRVPTPLDKVRQGARESAIRRAVDPSGAGWADGLDEYTFSLVRGMTVLELFLEKSDAKWAFSETAIGKKGPAEVKVDISKFPPGTEDIIREVGFNFQSALNTFHGRGTEPGDLTAPEALAGSVDPGAL
jgi:hypothetical protein